jgi:protein TIF31
MDGITLSEAMHNRGINIRYLGKITDMLSKVWQLEYVHSIAVSELICRSAKHLFTAYMQNVELMSLSAAISHFLNCFLSACQTTHTPQGLDEVHDK